MDHPFRTTDHGPSIRVRYLEPVALWIGFVVGPLSVKALADRRPFKNLPELVQRRAVSFELDWNEGSEVLLRFDF